MRTHTHTPIPNFPTPCMSEQVWLTVVHNHTDTHNVYLMCRTYSPTHGHSHSLALLYQDSARTILIKYSYNRFALLIIKQACCVSVYRSICKGPKSHYYVSLTHTIRLCTSQSQYHRSSHRQDSDKMNLHFFLPSSLPLPSLIWSLSLCSLFLSHIVLINGQRLETITDHSTQAISVELCCSH